MNFYLHCSGNIEVADLLVKSGADITIEDNYDDDAQSWADSKGHGSEFKKVLIENEKLEDETKPTKPSYDSSSSNDDSSASDENDDSDKAFLDAAVKGMSPISYLRLCVSVFEEYWNGLIKHMLFYHI